METLKHHRIPKNKTKEIVADTKKLLPFGLKEYFLEMADPSIELLEKTATDIMGLSHDSFQDISRSVNTAVYESELKKSLLALNVPQDEAGKIYEGAMNVYDILEYIYLKSVFNFDTEEYSRKIDPQRAAKAVLERIQVKKGERILRENIESLQNEPDLKNRARLAEKLKDKIMDFITTFNVTFAPRRAKEGETFEPTWENITQSFWWESEVHILDSSYESFTLRHAIMTAHAATKRLPFEQKVDKLPQFDQKEFDELRLKYGAKAASLMILRQLSEPINKLFDRYSLMKFQVPEFVTVPVDLYDAWKNGKDIDEELMQYYEWAHGLKGDKHWREDPDTPADYIVRSSAVFSEDGEHMTGAGIYESVRVPSDASFNEFKESVFSVYRSTESVTARAYRGQRGVEQEKMGLVIQKFKIPEKQLSFKEKSQVGYVNSRLFGVPDLIEITTTTSRNFIKRDELDALLALGYDLNKDTFASVHHFPPDHFVTTDRLLVKISQLALVVEKIWGKEIQMEFVVDLEKVSVVQVRMLPESSLKPSKEIQFPDGEEIHGGSAIGLGDMELEVLNDRDWNNHKRGVVVYPDNEQFSMRQNNDGLPREGAVIVARTGGRSGHIQTLCAEKGLVCIYPDVNDFSKPTLRYSQLADLRKVRVVSNGIEGRVYKIEDSSIEE